MDGLEQEMPDSKAHADANDGAMSIQVCVKNEQGLHARPAASLAQEAQKFDASVTLIMGDQEVDAKSILDILSLAAAQGCDLTIRAVGEDAEPALEHLERFFNNRLGEDK